MRGWSAVHERGLSRHSLLTAGAPWVSTVVQLVLAAVFLVAGAAKVLDPQASAAAVRAYQLVPAPLETLVGWALPFLEVVLGLLLAAGVFTRMLGAASAVLLAVLVAGVVSAAVRGLSIDCGCFGGGGAVAAGQTHDGREILRDTGLLPLALWLVWRPRSRWALDATSAERGSGREQDDHARLVGADLGGGR